MGCRCFFNKVFHKAAMFWSSEGAVRGAEALIAFKA